MTTARSWTCREFTGVTSTITTASLMTLNATPSFAPSCLRGDLFHHLRGFYQFFIPNQTVIVGLVSTLAPKEVSTDSPEFMLVEKEKIPKDISDIAALQSFQVVMVRFGFR